MAPTPPKPPPTTAIEGDRRWPLWWGAPLTTPRVVRAGGRDVGGPRRETDVGAASVLDDDVAAGAAVEDVEAGAAEQDVVVRVAAQRVGARAADEHVGAVAAVGLQADGVGRQPGRLDDVVAAQRVDRQRVLGRLGVRDADRSRTGP